MYNDNKCVSIISKCSVGVWIGVILWMSCPIIMMILSSIYDGMVGDSEYQGLTLMWYQTILLSRSFWSVVLSSMSLSICVSLLSCFVGGCAAFFCEHIPGIAAKLCVCTMFLLLLLPEIMLIIFLSPWYKCVGVPFGFCATLMAQVTYYIGIPFVLIRNGLQNTPPNIYLAAYDLGAREIKTLTSIVIPYLYKDFISSVTIVLLLSMDEFVINLFLSDHGFVTFPIYIYTGVKSVYPYMVMAISSLVFGIYLCLGFVLYSAYKRYI